MITVHVMCHKLETLFWKVFDLQSYIKIIFEKVPKSWQLTNIRDYSEPVGVDWNLCIWGNMDAQHLLGGETNLKLETPGTNVLEYNILCKTKKTFSFNVFPKGQPYHPTSHNLLSFGNLWSLKIISLRKCTQWNTFLLLLKESERIFS